MVCSEAKERAAAEWFGYGRWNAPYWFVGPEHADLEEPSRYEAWLDLGGGELVDRVDHENAHASSLPAHRAWERSDGDATRTALIGTVLAFEGRDPANAAAAAHYGSASWGRRTGDVAALELCAIPARSMSDPQRQRFAYVDARIATIRRRLQEHRPAFVVLYGADYVEYWTAIIGRRILIGVPTLVDGTIVTIVRHPGAYGVTNDSWIALGRRIRNLWVDANSPAVALSA